MAIGLAEVSGVDLGRADGPGRTDRLLAMVEPAAPTRPSQTKAVVLLTLALAALLALWGIGGYLLYTRAPANFGEPPAATASPSAAR